MEWSNQALKHLEAARTMTLSSQLYKRWLQLSVLAYIQQGDFYLAKEDRLMLALAQYQAGLRLLQMSHAQSEAEKLQERERENVSHSIETSFSPTNRLYWYLLLGIGQCYLQLSDQEHALKFYRQAATLTLGNTLTALLDHSYVNELTAFYWEQSRLFSEQGDFQQASMQVGRGLELCEQFEASTKLVNLLGELAGLEAAAGQYRAAGEAIDRVFSMVGPERLVVEIGSQSAYAQIHLRTQITLVQLRFKQGHLDEAAAIIDGMIERQHLTGAERPSELTGLLYQMAGEVQAALGNKEAAKSYYHKAMSALISTNSNKPTGQQQAELYFSYGQQLREWGEVDEAFELLEKAYKLRQL